MQPRPAPSAPMFVRRALPGDVAAVASLAETAPESSRWSADVFRGYLRSRAGGSSEPENQEILNWPKALFVACTPSGAVGFAVFAGVPIAGEYELENIAVDPDLRRCGAGLRLLETGLLWCRSWGPAGVHPGPPDARRSTALWLEVRASNAGAIAFYETAGFTQAGRRPGYYRDPPDDAVRMRKPIGPAC